MSHGGKRAGAGKPKGAKNKRTIELWGKADKLNADPATYLMNVMIDDKEDSDKRRDAAKALMPYLYSKLSSVELSGEVTDGRPDVIEVIVRKPK